MTENIWFFGTGHFAARCLELIAPKVPISLVVTQPPTHAGRGMKLRVSAVEDAAKALGLKLLHSEAVNKDVELIRMLEEEKPDVILVIDFGQWIGEPWLSSPKFGCINIHPSRLPQYRGAAPVQRAIIDGCRDTAVSLFRLVKKMDAGAIWLQGESEIGENETFPQLRDKMAEIGCRLFCENVDSLLSGKAVFTEQPEEGVTYAAKIEKSECLIDPNRTALELHNLVRGLVPAPGAYFMYKDRRIKVLETRVSADKLEAGEVRMEGTKVMLGTSEGSLELITLQPEGKKAMKASDWARGAIR